MTTLAGIPVWVSTWLGQLGWGSNYISTIAGHFGVSPAFWTSGLAGRTDYTAPSATVGGDQDVPTFYGEDENGNPYTQTAYEFTVSVSQTGGTNGLSSFTWYLPYIQGGGSAQFWDGSAFHNSGYGAGSSVTVYLAQGPNPMSCQIYCQCSDGISTIDTNTITLTYGG